MDRSPPVSSVHGILQARIMEWVAIPFSRGLSRPRDWTRVSRIAGSFFTTWATGEAPTWQYGQIKRVHGAVTPSLSSWMCIPRFYSGTYTRTFTTTLFGESWGQPGCYLPRWEGGAPTAILDTAIKTANVHVNGLYFGTNIPIITKPAKLTAVCPDGINYFELTK